MVVLLVVLVAVLVIVVTVALVPEPRSHTISWAGRTTGPHAQLTDNATETLCPRGAHAAVAFSSTGLSTTVSVTAPNGTVLFHQTAGNWTEDFAVAACAAYEFDLVGSGNGSFAYVVTLTYTAALL
jgi:hypothetical protein